MCIRVEARWSVSVSDTGAWRSTTTPLLALLIFDLCEAPLTLLAFDLCETKLLVLLPFESCKTKLLAVLPLELCEIKLLACALYDSPFALPAFEFHEAPCPSLITGTGTGSAAPVLGGGGDVYSWGRRVRRVLDVDTTEEGSMVSDVEGWLSLLPGFDAGTAEKGMVGLNVS